MRPPPRSTLFPYTTLFRSVDRVAQLARERFAERAARYDQECAFPSEDFADLFEHGLLAPTIPASQDRKSTRLNSSHSSISYAVFCLKKKNILYLAHR